MAYITSTDVRTISPLSTTMISNADLTTLIGWATAQLNQEILTHIFEEKVEFIDNERKNQIDGSTTTFYTQNKPFADLDDDGTVDTSDITVYLFDNTETRSSATVSSIDANLGKFTLSSAPANGNTMRVTYRYAPVDILQGSIGQLVKNACSYLVAALAYTKIVPSSLKRYSLDRLTVIRNASEVESYMKLYRDTVNIIQNKMALIDKGYGVPPEIPQEVGQPIGSDRSGTKQSLILP